MGIRARPGSRDPESQAREVYFGKGESGRAELILEMAGYDGQRITTLLQKWYREEAEKSSAERPILGGSNGGKNNGPDEGDRPGSRALKRIRDALFFGITDSLPPLGVSWPRKLSPRINLLPTKAQLKSYRKARKAHAKGNILEADQILSEGGYCITTSDELFESWSRWNQKRPVTERTGLAAYEKELTDETESGPEVRADRRFRYVTRLIGSGLLVAGALIAAGSISYQYVIEPYFSQQVSVQRPAQTAQQKPEAKPAAPKREPGASAAPAQQKPGFHGPIAPPAAQPGTTEPPRARVQEPAAPVSAPERPPTPAQGATQPAPSQKVFFYRDEYGARRELPVYGSRWTIDKVSAGNEGENRAWLLLETFYDVNRDGYSDNFEPQLPIELERYSQQEAEEMRDKIGQCKGQNEAVYVMLGRSVYPQTDRNHNVLGIKVPREYVKFLSRGCLD